MSKTAWIWTVVIVALVAVGGYFFFSMPITDEVDNTVVPSGESMGGDQEAPGPETVPNGTATGSVSGGVDVEVDMTPTSVSVSYDGTGFSPKDVTIKRGGKVTWTNTGSANMWVASASHPSHTVYAGTTRQEHCPDAAGTAFDQCAGGQSYTFTFSKAGTWKYHDHINASAFGSVTVVE